ncbi:MAG: AAA family ATPase [Williamsia sp.]|nr:AAA family ATPase [Williamsia sp.]
MELLERAQFLQTLRNGFQKALLREGHSFFIAGEAGIGKSSLIKAFRQAVEDSCQVYEALCDSLFTPRPLGPVYDLAVQMDPEMAEVFRTTPSRTELFARVAQEFAAGNRPTLLIIEDVHWADEASLDFIKFFARRISNTSCLLLLSYRDAEITLNHPLRNVLGELSPQSFSRILLTSLSRDAVQKIAAEKGYNGEDLFHVSGGNPFYVSEMVASYSPGIPDNIKDAVLAVYNRVKPNTKSLWDILSIMPEGLEHRWLDKINGQWQEAIENCFAHGILLVRNNRTVFKHELFRRTIETSLSPFKRLELNKKVLELFLESFEQSGAVERIVHYAKNAGENGLVAHFAPLAARQAAALGAHTEAAKLYLAAIEYDPDKEPGHLVQLYEAYTYECYLTNQVKEAIIYQTKARRILQETGSPEQVGNCLRFLSRLWWYDGHRREAELYAVQAIEAFDSLPPSKAKAMAYSNLSQLRMLAEDLPGCTEWGARAIDMATRIGDEEIRCHALNNVGTVRLKVPELQGEGQKMLEESLRIALHHHFHEHAARAYTNFISSSVSSKDYNLAEHYLEEAMQYCGPRHLHSWTGYMLSCKARILLERGNWEAAGALAEHQLSGLHQPGIVRLNALTIRAIIEIRGGKQRALDLLKEAKSLAFQLNEHFRIVPVAIAGLEWEWLTGHRMLTDEELAITGSLIKGANNTWLNSEAWFWLKKTRGIELDLPALYEPYQYLQEGKGSKAAAWWKEKGCPYETAFALFTGNEEQKREALVILQTLGADAVYQKLKSEMRSSGIRKIPRGLRSSTMSNPAQLTIRELGILQLLQAGASNKEIAASLFISPKTVDHHISSILFKLDVPSRTKAVGEATKLGILK